MKLKYYMRGLGIGIIVTAIIMSFTRQPQELTEAQIKAKARELGMVEENVLADLKKDDVIIQEETEKKDNENAETSEEITETEVTFEGVTEENTIDEEVVSENTVNEETMSETTDVENNSDENTGEIIPEEENNQENVIEEAEELSEKYVVISINGGNGSEIVSKRLYEAGLVSSEEEYNKFLVKNGYDRKLRVGNHEIPVGATEEEIAKILCGKN
ncbi:MAG: hypothetical protein IKL49_08715 [Lachnospiraceae bacterium]|nr:hypothetical protein [Lachnospiraceae bacterium]